MLNAETIFSWIIYINHKIVAWTPQNFLLIDCEVYFRKRHEEFSRRFHFRIHSIAIIWTNNFLSFASILISLTKAFDAAYELSMNIEV